MAFNRSNSNFVGRGGRFLFLNDPEIDRMNEVINPTFYISLDEYPAEDLLRYCTKLFYDKNIPVDFNKQIRLALAFFFKRHIGEMELKEIEDIKNEEAKIIEEARKKELPRFAWDKSNQNKKGE